MSKSNRERELIVVGLDVSDRSIAFCVAEGKGKIIEEGSLQASESALRSRFTGKQSLRIVLEVGPHSPWMSRLLHSLGHEVIVVNPHRLRVISDSINKTDRNDARTLALLGLLGPELLHGIEHRTEAAQNALSIIQSRAFLVGQRTALLNRVRGTVKSRGYGTLPRAQSAAVFVETVAGAIPESLHAAIDPLLVQIVSLSDSIREYDHMIEAMVKAHPVASSLREQIKGVGPLTSLAFVLTIENPRRFECSRDVGAYLGLVPRQHQSGSRSPELHITKAGDKMLRSLLVQCAHYIISRGPGCELQQWAKARIGENKSKILKRKIVIAVARKLAVLLHRLWTTGEAYDPFYQQKRRAAKESLMTAA